MIIVGDVHGKYGQYIKLVENHDKSLCVGDVGFAYSTLSVLDANNHRIIGGNHDNYDNLSPHFLGDYGVWNDIFYVRGAMSIDRVYRKEGISWWSQEQLSYLQLSEATEVFAETKPEIMITHEAPVPIKYMLCGEANDITTIGLGYMFQRHQPKLWIFGHHHRSFTTKLNGTKFICLDELETITI